MYNVIPVHTITCIIVHVTCMHMMHKKGFINGKYINDQSVHSYKGYCLVGQFIVVLL